MLIPFSCIYATIKDAKVILRNGDPRNDDDEKEKNETTLTVKNDVHDQSNKATNSDSANRAKRRTRQESWQNDGQKRSDRRIDHTIKGTTKGRTVGRTTGRTTGTIYLLVYMYYIYNTSRLPVVVITKRTKYQTASKADDNWANHKRQHTHKR